MATIQLTCAHHWSNRAYADYDLRRAACNAWQTSCLDTDTIRSVCRCSYLDLREIKA